MQKKKSLTYITLQEMIRICLIARDIPMLKKCHNLLGVLANNNKDYSLALENYQYYLNISKTQDDFDSMMFSYKQIGLCLQYSK